MTAGAAIRVAIAVTVAWGPPAVLACGHCVEDRIAAVYDHALVQRAAATGHRIAYFAWDTKGAHDPALMARIVQAAASAPGVIAGSVRVSAQPEAVAVGYDPRRYSEQSIEASLQARLRTLKVSAVRLQSGPAPATQALDADQSRHAWSP
jgi:hypothetical protein